MANPQVLAASGRLCVRAQFIYNKIFKAERTKGGMLPVHARHRKPGDSVFTCGRVRRLSMQMLRLG